LPARVSEDDADALIAHLAQDTAPARVDLQTGVITVGNDSVHFALDEVWREKLINGRDDIDLTRQHEAAIAAFRAARRAQKSWATPRGVPA